MKEKWMEILIGGIILAALGFLSVRIFDISNTIDPSNLQAHKEDLYSYPEFNNRLVCLVRIQCDIRSTCGDQHMVCPYRRHRRTDRLYHSLDIAFYRHSILTPPA